MKRIRLFLAVVILAAATACSGSGPLGPDLEPVATALYETSTGTQGSGG